MSWNHHWESWQAFLHMGGYGLYVWGSFGVLALSLAWEAWCLTKLAARVRLALIERWRNDESAGTAEYDT